MKNECTLQCFANGHWHDMASVLLLGDAALGHRAPSYTGYAMQWAVDHPLAIDAWALSSQLPVSLSPTSLPHWPAFLLDLLPQGFGREELLRQIGRPERVHEGADWPLLLAGAGNPIGHLRVKEAAQWLQERGALSSEHRGFSDDELAQRSDDFMQYLSEHGLFVAGSSGIQGEWPKILLTRARDGLLYLDHSLPDEAVAPSGQAHYIVKFGRGTDASLATILRNEAPYMEVARHLGLRVHGALQLRARALFIPRFDRCRVDNQWQRLAQESLATLTGQIGFGTAPSHELACAKLMEVCTDPAREILEYLKRDIANLAMGNKDNHARNTALTRNFDGNIALTPLFDFAPMYLHPDGIARRIRWVTERGAPSWITVLDALCKDERLQRDYFVDGLRGMSQPLIDIHDRGEQWGLESELLTHLRPSIIAQVKALEILQ